MSINRYVFSFDALATSDLRQLTEVGQFKSVQRAVRDSLCISRAIQAQAVQGFSEVLVRNPTTNETRVLVLPTLYPLKASG